METVCRWIKHMIFNSHNKSGLKLKYKIEFDFLSVRLNGLPIALPALSVDLVMSASSGGRGGL